MPIPLDQMEEKQLGRIVLTQERMGQLARLPRKCYRLPGVTRAESSVPEHSATRISEPFL